MNSYDDTDKTEQLPAVSIKEQQDREERVKAVRKIVLDWKKNRLNAITKDNQDTLILNEFRNDLVRLFYLLRDVMEGDDPSQELEKHELWKELQDYFPLYDGIERIDLTHGLHRDLVEFPFTFNMKLVNAFLKRNSLQDAEILPNK